MDMERVVALLAAFDRSSATLMRLRDGDFSLELEKAFDRAQGCVANESESVPSVEQTPTCPPCPQVGEEAILAPLPGTFYHSPGEEAAPFVTVGERVEKGQTIGIIEAMKVMNEVPSPLSGRIREVVAENGEVVGFHQVLMQVDVDV